MIQLSGKVLFRPAGEHQEPNRISKKHNIAEENWLLKVMYLKLKEIIFERGFCS